MRLQAVTARELMSAGPVSISAEATVEQAATFLTERGFGAAVAIDEAGHPIGVVTKTDVVIHGREQSSIADSTATVRDIMTPAVFRVKEDTPAKSVVEQMLALNVHHLFVVDGAGIVTGVISPMDVLKHLS